jgi:hypothetical protein
MLARLVLVEVVWKFGFCTENHQETFLSTFLVIPFLNQAFTLSAVLRRSSPYSLYCLVAARLPSRAHLDLEME